MFSSLGSLTSFFLIYESKNFFPRVLDANCFFQDKFLDFSGAKL